MDALAVYQKAILEVINESKAYYQGETNPLEVIAIIDEKGHHYQLLMLGWEDEDYTFQCLFHLDIKDGKVWIQWNDTDLPIEQELLRKGVPASQIVLGLKHPEYRQYSDFARS